MHFARLGGYDDAHPVNIITRGEGCYVWDATGKRLLDGLSGLFTVQVGHGRRELAEAARKQAEQLAYFPIWNYAHPPAIELAARVADLAPGDLNRVFFTSGGSEAVESAWKLARQYFRAIGQGQRHKVIAREIAYHGTTLGARDHRYPRCARRSSRSRRVRHTWPTPTAITIRSVTTRRRSCSPSPTLSRTAFSSEGPDTVAAVFLEPLQNGGGCFVPPEGWLP